MNIRTSFATSVAALCACGLMVSCGSDSVAGKTTTTGNGGIVVALGPDGKALAGCLVLAAREWDTAAGRPGTIDTLVTDSTGAVRLPVDAYAFAELRDGGRSLGAWIKRVAVAAGERRLVSLDSLRPLRGRWADRSSIGAGRVYLDSSLRSASLQDDGSFSFADVATGSYALRLDAGASSIRELGSVLLDSREVRYEGSGNVLLAGDATRSPLWIDDFESGMAAPLLRRSYPQASPWYMWWALMDKKRPTSTDYASILEAIGVDSTRPGHAFHARFAATDANGWVAFATTGLELDLADRSEVCVAYRSDEILKIEFQRDSVDGARPTLSATLPASTDWRDTCVSTSTLVPDAETPASLRSWNAFGTRILTIQFLSKAWGTYMDLDDIRMR